MPTNQNMKIAIVAPSGVPFCIGGAEKLWGGLQRAINEYTPHDAELIKLPSRENDFWSLIDSYHQFADLDLSMFDEVISGKYPAWMVSHRRHICYMLHPLRGVYDAYHMYVGDDADHLPDDDGCQRIAAFMRTHGVDRCALPEFWSLLDDARAHGSLSAEATAFPGPFSRAVIHYLDAIALHPSAICKYAAISHTVKDRKGYFPEAAAVQVIHPASDLLNLRCDRFDYFFTASRLDVPKRIDIMIEAMQRVSGNIRFKIAGSGPDMDRLRGLAAGDDRIEFLGFVPDSAMHDLYANALAVPFIPCDEDYGLITIEAMQSGKPVLTATDSGGPTEFVKHNENGFCIPPDAGSLAEKMQALVDHPHLAPEMGRCARRSVQHITWENTAVPLLNIESHNAIHVPTAQKRKKLTVAVTYPIYPPRGGGALRIYHLYRQLAKYFDVDVITFTSAGQPAFRGEIAPGVTEIRVPKSDEHQQAEWGFESKVGFVCSDLVMPRLYHLTPQYVEALRASAASADVTVASHPYLLPAIQECSSGPFWYESHNVEYLLKKELISRDTIGSQLVDELLQVEAACCRDSQLVMACAEEDKQTLCGMFSISPEKVNVVPNGVDTSGIIYLSRDGRESLRRDIGIDSSFLALFIGSWHGPNIECLSYISSFAQQLPDIGFIVLGSVAGACDPKDHPDNMKFLGMVDDMRKQTFLDACNVALNPMTSGSGTNLKMLEYMAAGLPVISTPFGARGLRIDDGACVVLTELHGFPNAIRRIAAESSDDVENRRELARAHVEAYFDWQGIADGFHTELKAKGLL